MIDFLYITTVRITPELIQQVVEHSGISEAEIKEYISNKGKRDKRIDDAFAYFGAHGVRRIA